VFYPDGSTACLVSLGLNFWSYVKGNIERLTVPKMSAPDGMRNSYSKDGRQYPRSIANSVLIKFGGSFSPFDGDS
jgi:hypothetical protein